MNILLQIDPSNYFAWFDKLRENLVQKGHRVSFISGKSVKNGNRASMLKAIHFFDKRLNSKPQWKYDRIRFDQPIITEEESRTYDWIINFANPENSLNLSEKFNCNVLDVFENKRSVFRSMAGIAATADSDQNIFIQFRITNFNTNREQKFYQLESLPFPHSFMHLRSRIFSRSLILIERIICGFPKLEDYKISSFKILQEEELGTQIKAAIVFLRTNLKRIIYKQQWFVSIKNRNTKSRKIVQKVNTVIADPFPFEFANKKYLFVEEMSLKDKRGFISFTSLDNLNNLEFRPALKEEFHLSYPHLFCYKNVVYMIPESYEARQLSVYKCEEFPTKWSHFKTIFRDTLCTDTNIFEYEGKWWLATTLVDYSFAPHCDDLFLFFSDSPFSDNWISHPQNPVVSGSNNSRNAGRVYTKNNTLFRPSQYCSERYGLGYKINRINVLNQYEYEEEVVETVLPKNKSIGTHTFNQSNSFVFEDQLRFIFRWM